MKAIDARKISEKSYQNNNIQNLSMIVSSIENVIIHESKNGGRSCNVFIPIDTMGCVDKEEVIEYFERLGYKISAFYHSDFGKKTLSHAQWGEFYKKGETGFKFTLNW